MRGRGFCQWIERNLGRAHRATSAAEVVEMFADVALPQR